MPPEPEIEFETGLESTLVGFLVTRFSADELRLLVAELPAGSGMSPHLPTSPATLYQLAEAAVGLLKRFGQLDAARASLLDLRPGDRDIITTIWALPVQTPATASPPSVPVKPALLLPPLPLGYVSRAEEALLREALTADSALVGITGLPGSGKTTCAVAAVREVAEAAFGAVCWLDAGSEALIGAPELRRAVAQQLGAHGPGMVSRADLARIASDQVGDGRLLVVLDQPRGRLDELIEAARCHPRATVLVIASDSAMLYSAGLRQPLYLGGFTPAQGLQVLAFWADTAPQALPPIAGELARAIGYHPQGLRLLGANVAGATDPESEWEYLNRRRREALLTRVALPGIPDVSLAVIIDEVVARLPGTARAVLDALAVPPPESGIETQSIAALAGEDPDLCRRTADAMVRASLVAAVASGAYALSPLAHLWTRDQSGFLDRYREMVAHLEPEQPALVWAIGNDDEALAVRMVEQSRAGDLGADTETGTLALLQAAFHGMGTVVEALLSRGADVQSADREGFTSLHYAAQGGRAEVAVDLVGRGLSPFRRNDGGKDAVYVAIYNWHAEVAEAILDARPAPPDDVAALDLTLAFAVHRSATGVARRLLALGASRDPDLGPGNSPLLVLALGQRDQAFADDLLRAGGTSFRRDTLGEALLVASQNGQEGMVASLLALGAPVSWRGVIGRTPLLQAASGGHDRCVRLLVAAGAPLDEVDEAGWTAAHIAAGLHQPAAVTVLAGAGADLNARGPSGVRPLTMAVRQAKPAMRQENRMSLDETGMSVSSVTVFMDLDPEVLAAIGALLDGGADVDAADDRGRTALHYAAGLLQLAMVSALLARGADAAIRDDVGKTAYDLAQEAMAVPEGLRFTPPEAVLKLLAEAAADP